MTVEPIIARPIRAFNLSNGGNVRLQLQDLSRAELGLNRRLRSEVSHEFSGGRRHRGIAARWRLTGARQRTGRFPRSTFQFKRRLIDLMGELQRKNLAYLSISHDPAPFATSPTAVA